MPIKYSLTDGVGVITLNRPDKFNAFTRELALAVQAQLRQCADDEQVKVICLTGEGRAFCAGQDLGEIVGPNPPDLTKILQEHLNPIVELIRGIEKPIVAAVNGVAAGAGANIALACDITVAKSSASFLQAFSKIGLIPDSGGTYFLPRLVGWQKATAYMMLAEKISAEEAERVGMIYACYPDEAFDEKLQSILKQLTQMPPLALRLTKRALNASMRNNLDVQLDLEDELQTIAGRTADYKEGVQAFIEKRVPVFKGE